MADHTLSNVEALLNIGANLSEILGIAGGMTGLLWGWMPAAGGLKGYSKRLTLFGLLILVVGLAVPGIINWLVAVNIGVAILAGLVLTLVCVGMGGYLYFAPFWLADATKHPNRTWIQVLNCLFFVPFNIAIAMAILSFSGKDKRINPNAQPVVLGCQESHSDPET